MKNKDVLIYRIAFGLFSLMLLAGAITYFVKYDMVSETFTNLGVPAEIIYPLAIAKILGILAIWFVKSPIIKVMAFAGFGIDLILAILAHLKAGDGDTFGPVVPLILLIVSFIYYRKTKAQGLGLI